MPKSGEEDPDIVVLFGDLLFCQGGNEENHERISLGICALLVL